MLLYNYITDKTAHSKINHQEGDLLYFQGNLEHI